MNVDQQFRVSSDLKEDIKKKRLTELTPEQKAQVVPWHEKWVKIANRTEPQTIEDRNIMHTAIRGLYQAANLPQPRYVLFVPSPVCGQVVSGMLHFAMRHNRPVNLNIQTSNPVINAIVKVLTPALDLEGLLNNTETPVDMDETKSNWGRQMVLAFFPNANADDINEVCSEIKTALAAYSGGNMWTAGVDYISFFRHVVKLDIDYTDWDHYEKAAIHAGFRFMYRDFTVVCDFPEVIHLDENGQSHNTKGPSHRWRDGYEIYNWHGTLIPPEYHWIVKNPEKLTPGRIRFEVNKEMKIVMKELARA